MKILFLDIDGVLNNDGQDWTIERSWTIHDPSVALLNRLLDEIPDLNIVISSTWRVKDRGQEATVNHLVKHGFKHASRVIGSTPDFGDTTNAWFRRGEECLEWIELHNNDCVVEMFAFLDDQKDMFLTLPMYYSSRLVITNQEVGFVERDFDKLKEILCSK